MLLIAFDFSSYRNSSYSNLVNVYHGDRWQHGLTCGEHVKSASDTIIKITEIVITAA